MQTKTILTSFSRGELSAEMFGRFDQVDMHSGAAKVTNFLVKPQGPVVTRPGLLHLHETRNGAPARLIPFVHGVGQGIVVEATGGKFRFYADGGVLLYAIAREATSTSIVLDTIEFAEPHGFVPDDVVNVLVSAGGTLPTGLSLGVDYYVRVVDTVTIQLATIPAPNTAIALLTTPVGTMRVAKLSDMPKTYRLPRTYTLTVGTDPTLFEFGVPHSHDFNDPIELVGTPPAPFALNTTYYVSGYTATGIRLAAVPGSPTSISASVNGTGKTAYVYEHGDVAYVKGASGAAVVRCVKSHPLDNGVSDPVYWTLQREDGILEVDHPYSEAEVFDFHYAQAVDVLTFTYPNRRPYELRRLGPIEWAMVELVFGSSLPAPTGLASIADRGHALAISQYSNSGGRLRVRFAAEHNLAPGDVIWTAVGVPVPLTASTYYVVSDIVGTFEVVLATLAGLPVTYGGATVAASGNVYYSSASADTEQKYQVTAVDAEGVESIPSALHTVSNVLAVAASFNYLEWDAVAGAVSYRVYKQQTGLFGYIGETTTTTFTDDNIAPDLGATPPIFDADFGISDQPHAVCYFAGRRVFASTPAHPDGIWFSRANTDADFTYTLPIQDDDRIYLRVREMHAVRNLVPLADLLAITQSGEWRIGSKGDTLTPTTVEARAQSYIGCTEVQPVVVNASVLFCAARGGHIREMGYNWQAQGYITGDVSLRAAHLFDDFEVLDMAYTKAPLPIVWCPSSSGDLLALTYVPEEQVGGWSVQRTGGSFVSCAAISGFERDILFAVVKRDGVHYVEQFAPIVSGADPSAVCLDRSLTFDGTNTSATTVRVTGGRLWTVGEQVTLTASAAIFRLRVGADRDDAIVLASGGAVRVTSVTSGTVARGVITEDIPTTRDTPTAAWAWGRRSFSGLDYLEGETVTLVSGESVYSAVVFDGVVTISAPVTKAVAGVPFTSTLQTLPMSLQIDGSAQGRSKNLNRAWLRVFETRGLKVGPSGDRLVPVADLDTAAATGEQRVTLAPEWTRDGQVVVQQSKPFPATIVGVTLEVSIG